MTVFLPSKPADVRRAFVVCPGGGYGSEVFDREGFNVAERLNGHGYAAFVLKYRLPGGVTPRKGELPVPIQDVQRAIRLVRANAEKWNIDAKHVGVMGFSAGGHLAGSAATMFTEGNANAADIVERLPSRPDVAVLVYPVASMHDPLAHKGSRKAIIGENADETLRSEYSIDQRVTENTPPLFLVHAEDDGVVNIENSYRIQAAAKAKQVPCELTEFAEGGHGFGVAFDVGEANTWFDRCMKWLDQVDR